ncbi:hypothetical protein EIN_064240 [Entamoeba invadens IP1]|uniref:Uncharacterized protein n=1 Tax=Entamoeba invadens IP1 TaxID=370355 RepID=A0A0A1TV53_ENTIV|nr:hypothetical protein EIN_064240 [Entamoeba invadens IP1]ELP84209.1 hypothetical protein EIN_064240 [Entamoeba invadens IP1]|eukprot:XP_004183555.1 hypothetical protein EIN_064240 [Entamoeba invadens IP1]
MFGLSVFYIGSNTLQVVSRTLVLDIIPIEHQHPCALMFITHSALAKTLAHFTFFLVNVATEFESDSQYTANCIALLILFVVDLILVPVSSFTTFFTATESYSFSETSIENKRLSKFMTTVFNTCAGLNRYTLLVWIILFLGWTANLAFENSNSELYHIFSISNDEEYWINPKAMFELQHLVIALSQLTYCFYMFKRQTYPWYSMFITNGISSVTMTLPFVISLVISFFYEEINKELFVNMSMIFLTVFVVPVGLNVAQLLSVPFALLKNLVSGEFFGISVGLYNAAIILSKFVVYVVTYFLFKNYEGSKGNEDLEGNYYIMIATSLTIILYLITAVASYFFKIVYKYKEPKSIEQDQSLSTYNPVD